MLNHQEMTMSNEFHLKKGEVSKEPVGEAGELGPSEGQSLKMRNFILLKILENVAKVKVF